MVFTIMYMDNLNSNDYYYKVVIITITVNRAVKQIGVI